MRRWSILTPTVGRKQTAFYSSLFYFNMGVALGMNLSFIVDFVNGYLNEQSCNN